MKCVCGYEHDKDNPNNKPFFRLGNNLVSFNYDKDDSQLLQIMYDTYGCPECGTVKMVSSERREDK